MYFLENATFDWMDLLNFHEGPFRAKYIPAKVWKDLDRYRNDSVGLTNYFKKWRTRIEWFQEKSNAKMFDNYVCVGGEYSPEDRQCVIQIHTHYYNDFNFTDVSWKRFKYKVIQVHMHELIHFMQFDRRYDEWSNYVVPYKKVGHAKVDKERKYLSEFDEIQAYAHCVLLDYKVFKPDYTTEQLIKRATKHRDSKTLHYFLKTFNYDYKNNVAVHKIIQQIIKWDRKYDRVIRASKRK
jgi:hypothetical protein